MWLICRATFGREKNKLLVRGVKGVEWVFCPAIKGIKRDRVSIEQCQKCKYLLCFEQTHAPETPSTKRKFLLGATPSKATFHVARPHCRSRITHPHSALCPHIPSLMSQREPLIDVFEEEDHLIVLAELPGIDEKDVKIKTNENTVTITAENAKKKYLKIVRLPTRVNKDTIQYTYRNNILQVRLEKL